jgi:limonene-1,2-epoxide hydrolase
VTSTERFDTAIAAIDAGNADDPNLVTVRGRAGPKEVLHAELVSEWVVRLQPDADEALLLAARGHHFRRWTVPRASAPAGRAGYLKWRKARQDDQARELGDVLARAGYDEGTVQRVQALVRKEHLATDPDVQVLEDALCLVFLETQLADVAARLEPATLTRVLARTAAKMSDAGRAAIAEVPLDAAARDLLDAALARDVVEHYLAALAAHDWAAVAATLADGVERMGPYRDAYRGRAEYAGFLTATISALRGYQLDVDRMHAAGSVVTVELRETVDDGDERLETSEAVVFDTANGHITKVAVYVQTSERHARTVPE